MADEGYQPFPDVAAWAAVPFDPTTYDQYAALLEQARAQASEEAREHAVKTAMRYAGTDTGAIEGLYTTDRGFTRTVAIEAAGWEAAANERGPNAAAIIKDQIGAYEWVLDLVTESRPAFPSRRPTGRRTWLRRWRSSPSPRRRSRGRGRPRSLSLSGRSRCRRRSSSRRRPEDVELSHLRCAT